MIENDEWARLAAFNLKVAEEEERLKAERAALRRDSLRETLAQQIKQREEVERGEKELAQKYHEVEMEELR